MTALKGEEGELRFTLEIKRAATGDTETVELVGKIGDNELTGVDHGSNTQHSST